MSAIDVLVAADRIVLAGLGAYDQATGRLLARLRELMREAGYSEAEIEAGVELREARLRKARDRLHRDLWCRAMPHVAAAMPGASSET